MLVLPVAKFILPTTFVTTMMKRFLVTQIETNFSATIAEQGAY
jgi:hypothetical protein